MSLAFRIKGFNFYLPSLPNHRAGLPSPVSNRESSTNDSWNEIDRRNGNILHPMNDKDATPSSTSFSFYRHYKSSTKQSNNKSSQLNSSENYQSRQKSLLKTDESTHTMNPSMYLEKYHSKPASLMPISNDSSFLFGNSIIKSNKAQILNIFEQQSYHGIESTTYIDKHGVVISEDGPFWPDTYRILHPTPKLLNRTSGNKEFYLLTTNPNSHHRQTFDNQPAIYKFTSSLKHSTIVYDMDKTSKHQPIKCLDDEQMCPSLIFESRFEGGNLRQVKRIGQFEYELILRPDLYTRRHTQWYYFRVQNMIANITYRFRIINLTKKKSLYSEGMQVLLISDVESKKESRGWYRVGHHINYGEYKQKTYNSLLDRDINYYELDFQFEFPHSGDTCYMSHCYPYTFSDLKEDLDHLSITRPRHIFRRDVLCESRAGNSCFIITVTDENVPMHKKKIVLITARIHPGETNSSYMMRGLLEFITSNDKLAQKLRSQLVFKIIPMLNPDGVIVGNYRCSLTGKDMNRNFRHPRKQTFPIIYHLKELIQNLQKEQREILVFCDLHGHSRKSNVFAYGCDGCDGPEPDMQNFLHARVLPFLMSKTAPDMFAFDYCKFHIHRCKESTGRVVMWKEMLIRNSFTLEASFAGSSIVQKPSHFNIYDLEKFGRCICQSIGQYLDILADSNRLDSILMDITKTLFMQLDKDKVPSSLLPTLYPENEECRSDTLINSVSGCLEVLKQYRSTINPEDTESSSDSDSDPEGGELPDIGYRKEPKNSKKKPKKNRKEKTLEERSHKTNNKNEVDKANRSVPQRGSLFTSKYANRTGNGLPIFTTERALERRNQKRSESVLQDGSDDRTIYDEADIEPEQNYLITRTNPDFLEANVTLKRAASFTSLPQTDLINRSNDQMKIDRLVGIGSISNSFVQRKPNSCQRSPQDMFKMTHGTDFERTSNYSPSGFVVPNLLECTTCSHRPTSINENDQYSDEQQNDSQKSHSSVKLNSPLLKSRISHGNQSRQLRRYVSSKTNPHVIPQPVNTVESLLKERPITVALGKNHSSDSTGRFNQILKKRLY